MVETYVCDKVHKLFGPSEFSYPDFVGQARVFVREPSEAERPWCGAVSVSPTGGIVRRTLFTFTDFLLEKIVRNPREWSRDVVVAQKYGYIGFSNGGRNGIVPLRDADRKMRSAVDRFVERADLSPFEVYDPQGVKIVVHRPSGLRTIGVYDFRTDHALFFGQMHY